MMRLKVILALIHSQMKENSQRETDPDARGIDLYPQNNSDE